MKKQKRREQERERGCVAHNTCSLSHTVLHALSPSSPFVRVLFSFLFFLSALSPSAPSFHSPSLFYCVTSVVRPQRKGRREERREREGAKGAGVQRRCERSQITSVLPDGGALVGLPRRGLGRRGSERGPPRKPNTPFSRAAEHARHGVVFFAAFARSRPDRRTSAR